MSLVRHVEDESSRVRHFYDENFPTPEFRRGERLVSAPRLEEPVAGDCLSHAKFIVVDHEVLLLTSANFSFSAENRNIEFGLLVRDSALAKSVESTMTSKHGTLYELA